MLLNKSLRTHPIARFGREDMTNARYFHAKTRKPRSGKEELNGHWGGWAEPELIVNRLSLT